MINCVVADALARRYSHRGEETDDLVQVAELALVLAVDRFDPDRGEFLAFAVPTILGSLKRHFRDHGWMVRPPRRLQDLQTLINREWPGLVQSLGHAPTTQEMANAVGCDVSEVPAAQGAHHCYRPASLDSSPGEADPLASRVADLEEGFDVVDAVATLDPACRQLSQTDRRLLQMRFFEELTQRQIAEEMGVSQMQISRSLTRILAQLRELLADPAEPTMTAAS